MQTSPTPRPLAAVLAAPLACLVAACAAGPTPAPTQPPRVPGDPVSGSCNAKAASAYVGRTYSDAVADEAKKAAGAQGVRVIRPGMAVTMDYRAGRLNLELDGNGRIVKASCG